MTSVHDMVTEQFRQWELRGRGWKVYDNPVCLEPPFLPFTGYQMPASARIDDGHQPTFLSSLVQRISRKLATSPPPAAAPEIEEEPEPEVLVRDSLVELPSSLPAKLDISKEAFEQFLSNLSLCREPIAFELLGLPGRVTVQFAAHPEDARLVRRQLQAHFPEAVFQMRESAMEQVWNSCRGEHSLAAEFGLEREVMFPLASGKLDSFVGVIGALSELEPGEFGLFQVLFQPVHNDWAESITHAVMHEDGKPFFVNMPELSDAAKNKISRPLYAAVVRILIRTGHYDRTSQIARDFAGSLRVFASPQGNALIPLNNDDYPSIDDHVEDVLCRQSRRPGMLLNSDELIGFVHLPSSAVRSAVLLRDSGRTKAAPGIVRQPPGVLIGDNEHAGESVPIYLTADQRVRHTHIIGTSGTGKSSLLLNLIRQDIEHGDGVAVLDPHGDLIDQILGVIPENRVEDVVLVNPSDVDFPIGFNILQAHSDEEKNLLASDLVSVFQRLSTSWGDQMNAVLQNAILSFLESNRGGTLADLRRFLIEPPFRSEFLKTVQDPELIYYWQKVFPQLTGGKSIGPVLTRLQDFFSRKPLRNMVSQPENKLDFADIMDTGKIFLAKLSQGLCGTENSYLLGTLLVSKFQQLAMARQGQAAATRKDFWLYIDEFDHFITPSMAEILKGARKYRLGLTLAHQELHQLQSDPTVASAVATQPCTRIVFRVGDDDAKKLGDGFESFDAKSLKNLPKFHAIARVEQNDFDFNLAIRKPEMPEVTQASERREKIIAASRKKYATPRAEIETALMAKLGIENSGSMAAVVKPVPARVPKLAERKASEIPKPTGSEKEKVVGVPATAMTSPSSVDLEESQHTSIKDQIGAEAESLDYTVSYEELFPAVQGRADVVLRRGNQSIVCQVTVKTPVEYEAESVRKFLKADFTCIAVVSINRRKLNQIQQMLEEAGSQAAKVGFYSPEEFISKLFDWAADDPEGGTIERSKLRKQQLDLGSAHLTEAKRKENQTKWLAEIAQRMKR